MRNEINFVNKRRGQENPWLGRSNARILWNPEWRKDTRASSSRVPTWPEEQVVHAWERVQPREWAKRRFSRRPFQKFRRRHTDSPASSYELASSAQSSFRFFRMEWPAFDPRTAKGCLICWTGRQAFGPRCCVEPAPMKIGTEAIPGNSISLEERRTVLLWPGTAVFIIYSFIPLHGKRKYCSRCV